MKTNLYNDTLNLSSRFLHPFSKIHSRNLEEARKERKERKIARGRMEKNDESVGKYLISKGRRVSRLGEGWERPGDQQSENRIVGGRLVARAAGGDAKVPFEDSYFPRSHRCHTSPAILRLSLHCGNHNYTCGCLLIAPPPPGGSSRGEKEGGREGEPCILLRFRFFSSIPSPTLLFLLSRFHLRTSKLDRSFPSRFSERDFEIGKGTRRGRILKGEKIWKWNSMDDFLEISSSKNLRRVFLESFQKFWMTISAKWKVLARETGRGELLWRR